MSKHFTCAVHDVISLDGDEVWIDRALVILEDEEPVAQALVASQGVLFETASHGFHWCCARSCQPAREPPLSLEFDGHAFARRTRLPVVVRVLPDARDEEMVYATYEGIGDDALFVLTNSERAHAWLGRRISPDRVERWGHVRP
jgi:hypothetical protein